MPACAGLSARRRAGQECRLGIHGSRLRQIGRPGGDDRAFTHGYRKLYRHATASASPGLTQTLDPELLAAAGIKYIDDWVYDGQPTVIGSAKGPLVTFPYTVELNDIPMMIGRHHESDYLLKRAIDQFDRLYAEGKHRAKIMALAIHPYISGQPHRIKYLEAILRLWRPLRGLAALQWRADPRLVSLDVRACRHRRWVKVGC